MSTPHRSRLRRVAKLRHRGAPLHDTAPCAWVCVQRPRSSGASRPPASCIAIVPVRSVAAGSDPMNDPLDTEGNPRQSIKLTRGHMPIRMAGCGADAIRQARSPRFRLCGCQRFHGMVPPRRVTIAWCGSYTAHRAMREPHSQPHLAWISACGHQGRGSQPPRPWRFGRAPGV